MSRQRRKRFWSLLSLALVGIAGAVIWLNRPSPNRADKTAAVLIENEPIVATVGYGNIENVVPATGNLNYRDLVPVQAETSGKLLVIFVGVGDQVEAGQTLAQIDSSGAALSVRTSELNLEKLRNQLEQRRGALDIAETALRRQEKLADAGSPVDRELEQAQSGYVSAKTDLASLLLEIQQSETALEQAKLRLERTTIKAPMAGTIVSVDRQQDTILNAEHEAPTVLQMADLTQLTVEADVSEADIPSLAKGMTVYFTMLGAGDRRWYGTLRQVRPLQASTGRLPTYAARIDVDNPDGQLLPGMSVQAFFVTGSAENVLTVPLGALHFADRGDNAQNATVDLVLADGTRESRDVVVGARDHINAEILSGLEEGDRVVAGIMQTRSVSAERLADSAAGPPKSLLQ